MSIKIHDIGPILLTSEALNLIVFIYIWGTEFVVSIDIIDVAWLCQDFVKYVFSFVEKCVDS